MTHLEKYNRAFDYFKKSYRYKMGGTQTIILPNGKEKFFDDREYYSGRGAKYNSSIRHDEIGIVKVTKKEYSEFLKYLRDREMKIKQANKQREQYMKRVLKAKEKGIYDIEQTNSNDYLICLSYEESSSKIFDPERLARSLNIKLEDANLLKSEGKTYVLAETNDGRFIELYHSSLDWNPLYLYFKYVTSEYAQTRYDSHKEWSSAPYADLLGQTDNINHLVC
jgi:hypothetical protein